jgi:hypothetical protein
MARGRKPLGKRAMTDAERQRRRRKTEQQTRPEHERTRRLRVRLLNAVGAWVDANPKVSMLAVVDAIHELATLVTLSANRTAHEWGPFRLRYLNGEALDDDTDNRLHRLLGAEALKKASEKIRDL